MSEIEKLQQRLDYQFRDVTLLENAVTHRSTGGFNNERLEFLGDAVLSHIMAEELYRRHPKAREGELSRMRSSLVRGDRLTELARCLDLSSSLRLGVGEQRSGGQHRHSILADAFEAIIGAVYLDGGMEVCRRCVLRWYGEGIESLSEVTPEKDAKSILQEWLQAHKLPLPAYEATVTGEAHAQTFNVTCRVEGLDHVTEGTSTNRRKAEQEAAQHFLELLNDE